MKQAFITFFSLFIISFTAISQNKAPADSIESEDAVFEKVETEASFPGGDAAWRKFLERNLNAAIGIDNGAPVGKYTVWVQFVVDRQGHIGDIKALTNIGYGMEKEVIRVIKQNLTWEPAMQNGRTVKAYRKQPVTFIIDDESFEITAKENYVLYVGINNPLTIKVPKVKDENLSVTISQGTITAAGDGNYIVRVPKTGKAIIEIYNAKKGNKMIGSAYFEVKLLSNPAAIKTQ